MRVGLTNATQDLALIIFAQLVSKTGRSKLEKEGGRHLDRCVHLFFVLIFLLLFSFHLIN